MKKIIKMNNLDCANCAAKMEKEIKKIAGVESASINFMLQRLSIEADEASLADILPQIEKACKKIDRDIELAF